MKMICSEYKRFKKVCDGCNCEGSVPKEYYIDKDFELYKVCQISSNCDEYGSLVLDRVRFDESVPWPKLIVLIPVPITYYMEEVLKNESDIL
jgi:hypothetical protein